MAKRVTVMIDDDLDVKIRTKQAAIINKEHRSCSFSEVLNYIIEKGLKN